MTFNVTFVFIYAPEYSERVPFRGRVVAFSNYEKATCVSIRSPDPRLVFSVEHSKGPRYVREFIDKFSEPRKRSVLGWKISSLKAIISANYFRFASKTIFSSSKGKTSTVAQLTGFPFRKFIFG
ncbi:hypothetical protein EVAR_19642_1 [Eumeta japonica]|uniref:Uncharacterized protein n=1 Tax=Eumeta variegata TaxID=151549 RepID=A0A4C1UFP6_EUMVA|nr:hypothetical protein EVAR_19642_1 [Eumeta japonica]